MNILNYPGDLRDVFGEPDEPWQRGPSRPPMPPDEGDALRAEISYLKTRIERETENAEGWKRRAKVVEDERDAAYRELEEMKPHFEGLIKDRDYRADVLDGIACRSFDELVYRFKHLVGERDRGNAILRNFGLPDGRNGFDTLVASHQQLAAIDKALKAVDEESASPEEDEPSQLDRRLEARVNDIPDRIRYHFPAPPATKPREPFGWVIMDAQDQPLGVNGTLYLYPWDKKTLLETALGNLNSFVASESVAKRQPFRKVLVMLGEPLS